MLILDLYKTYYSIMIRREFQEYIDKLDLKSNEVEGYWSLYDRIFEPNSPLTFNQKTNLLLSELRKMK
mgnify:FL=1|tara:strand:- start:6796 stop:6999 length:204 start_codon:yes stop_codon:yes gene_type:complete